MPLDPRAKRLLDMVALGASADPGQVTAQQRRASFRALMGLSRTAEVVGASEMVAIESPAGALPARVYTPLGASAAVLPGLVFLHGGGLVAGDLDTHDGLCRHLANKGGCRVVSVEYRLAPEHPFPAAWDDAAAAIHGVARTAGRFGVDPHRLAVGGDSAGAILAIHAATAARDGADPALRFMLLLCPVLDLSARRPSRIAFGQGYLLDQATMDRDLAHCLVPALSVTDPRLSPILASDLTKLPPALIHSAEYDPLRDEAHDYAERLRQAGVPVRAICHAGMIHNFLGLDRVIPAAGTALEQIGQHIRDGFQA